MRVGLIMIFTLSCLVIIHILGCNKDSYDIEELKIGKQIWMKKNLNTDKFRNGDLIPEVKSYYEWEKMGKEGKPACCFLFNDPKNGVKFGKLYNWYAVNDPRNIAPTGWHIPSKEEWEELINYLNGDFNALKDEDQGENEGKGTNLSGFSAKMGGFRYASGYFYDLHAFFWTSTKDIVSRPISYYIFLPSHHNKIYINMNDWNYGYSVRCVKY